LYHSFLWILYSVVIHKSCPFSKHTDLGRFNFEERYQGVTKRCRLSCWPIALSYMSPNAVGRCGWRGLSQLLQLCTWCPNKLWAQYNPNNGFCHLAEWDDMPVQGGVQGVPPRPLLREHLVNDALRLAWSQRTNTHQVQGERKAYFPAVLGIRDILVQIRIQIRGSVPLTKWIRIRIQLRTFFQWI